VKCAAKISASMQLYGKQLTLLYPHKKSPACDGTYGRLSNF
jgi:hypothetical protein